MLPNLAPTVNPPACHYDPATAQFLTRDPLEVLTRSAYGYASNDPVNRTDPTGLWDIPDFVPVVGGMCIDIADPNCVTPAEGQPNDVGNFASGMLSLNPITGTMDAFGLIDTGKYADTCSGAYRAGQFTMAAIDIAAPAHAGWTALNSGRGIGIGNTVRVARHQAHRAMPELAGGAVSQANWLKAHHAFRTHWHWTWRGVRNPGGM